MSSTFLPRSSVYIIETASSDITTLNLFHPFLSLPRTRSTRSRPAHIDVEPFLGTQESRDLFWQILVRSRKAERLHLIRFGLMDDPLVPKRLSDAISSGPAPTCVPASSATAANAKTASWNPFPPPTANAFTAAGGVEGGVGSFVLGVDGAGGVWEGKNSTLTNALPPPPPMSSKCASTTGSSISAINASGTTTSPPHILTHPVYIVTSAFRAHVQSHSTPITRTSALAVGEEGMRIFGELAGWLMGQKGKRGMIYLVAGLLEHLFERDTIEDMDGVRGGWGWRILPMGRRRRQKRWRGRAAREAGGIPCTSAFSNLTTSAVNPFPFSSPSVFSVFRAFGSTAATPGANNNDEIG
ncbi:hypothetical protein C8J55DRAFT_567270 [Lentinula edodes]|uniref:Uncharacterized protein n=1 Tax=Lentinula lateritia TaxID=40482 RepID=A0A9W8ZPV6_9AGAR|nr:hypothetical protein C8J55DRAFT_567270 [Lentinula edodes]